MKLANLLVGTALIVAAFSVAAQATSTPRVDTRQDNQGKRIEQGVKSGELTKREARRLKRGQHHVQNMENRATADGVVTKKERAQIEQAQDRQSKRIARQKHDRQQAHK